MFTPIREPWKTRELQSGKRACLEIWLGWGSGKISQPKDYEATTDFKEIWKQESGHWRSWSCSGKGYRPSRLATNMIPWMNNEDIPWEWDTEDPTLHRPGYRPSWPATNMIPCNVCVLILILLDIFYIFYHSRPCVSIWPLDTTSIFSNSFYPFDHWTPHQFAQIWLVFGDIPVIRLCLHHTGRP